MRRLHEPGASASSYSIRQDSRQRQEPGKCGQFEEWHQPLKFVGNEWSPDRCWWRIGHLLLHCVLDWRAGDGATPAVGPTLDITDGGGPDETDVSPWADFVGNDVPSAHFDGTVSRRTATSITPSSGQNVRVLALVCPFITGAASNYRILSTRNVGGAGFSIYYRADTQTVYIYKSNSAGGAVISINMGAGWQFIDCYWDLGGALTIRVNGNLASVGSGGGDHLPNDGLAIGEMPNGSGVPWFGKIARIMVFHGDMVDGSVDHESILESVFGISDIQGPGPSTFSRDCPAVQLSGTHYHIIGSGAPRSGYNGLHLEPPGTNKVWNNTNNQNTNGWTVAGGGAVAATLTAVNDAANLGVNLREAGPNVLCLDNSAGDAPAYAYGGSPTGNLNKHSASIFARYTGAQPQVGVRDISLTTFTSWGNITQNYVRTLAGNQTPGDIDEQFCVCALAGCVVYFIWGQLEEFPYCTSPMPNLSAVGDATRLGDQLTTSFDPRDDQGSIECGITPVGWSGIIPGAASTIVRRTTGKNVGMLLFSPTAPGQYRFTDGTSNVRIDIAPVDGVREMVRTRWNLSGKSISSQDLRADGDYDGTLRDSGFVELGVDVAPVLIDSFRIFRNGDG